MLKQQIQQDLNRAIKERNEITATTLRLVLAAFLSKEKEKRYALTKENPEITDQELEEKTNLTEQESINVISSEVKKRKEAISGFEQGGRQESAEKEKSEMEILQKYLPEQLSEQEIKELIQEAINKTGAQEIKDMGKVMAELAPKIKGKADGGQVSAIVKELLNTN